MVRKQDFNSPNHRKIEFEISNIGKNQTET